MHRCRGVRAQGRKSFLFAPLLPRPSAPLLVFPLPLRSPAVLAALIVLLLLTFLSACNPATVTPPTPILLNVAGSTTMTPLLTDLARAYKTQQPHLTVDIQGGGSTLGRRLVETDQIDIGLISSTPNDLPDDLQVTPIARDTVAIIVNAKNPLKGLSLRELRDVFNGRLIDWREVDGPPLPIQVVSREDGSGTRTVFEAKVMDGLAVTSTAIVMPNSQAVVDFVVQNSNAVGYVSSTLFQEGVSAVSVEGIAPTRDTLADNSYFLRRELFIVTRRPTKPEVEAFLEFVLSPAGQTILGRRLLPIK